MKRTVVPPSPDLADIVQHYYVLESSSEDRAEESHVPPLGYPVMIFHYGSQIKEYFNGYAPGREMPCTLVGQLTFHALLRPSSTTKIFGVNFYPTGMYQLLGEDMAQFTNRLSDAFPFFNDSLRDTLDAMVGEDNDVSAVAGMVEDLLRRQREETGRTSDDFDRVIGEAFLRRGRMTIEELVSSLGVSQRTVERGFKRSVGVTAKQYFMILRHTHLFELLLKNPGVGIGELLDLCGFYDQSHLIREFRRFAGMAPRKIFGEEHPFARIFFQ